jgi:hypothetical protein
MEAVAHDPKFAAKAGIPQKVGKDFAAADRAVDKRKKIYDHPSSRKK